MTALLALLAVLAGNALAGGAPRVSAPVKSGAPVAAPVPVLRLGVAALTPGPGLSASLSPAPSLSAPALSPAPSPALSAAADAPAALAAARAASLPAPGAAAASPAARGAAPALSAPADAPRSAEERDGAAPAGALASAEWAAAAPESRLERVFDGESRRGWLDRLVLARPLRPATARLTRGVKRDLERYREPPRIARKEAALQAGALAGGLGAFASFAAGGGLALTAVMLVFAGLGYGVHRLELSAARERTARETIVSPAFQARAQGLLDGMRRAVGATRPVAVRVLRGNGVNAMWSAATPDVVFVTYGASVLDDGRLRAVLAHELGHRAFRDNMAPLLAARAMLSQATWLGGGALAVNAALALLGWNWSLALGPTLLLLGAGLALSALGQLSLGAFSRLWEYRADHYGGWLTHPRDMANALGAVYHPGAARPRRLGDIFFGSHPDTRRRIVELRGREAAPAAKGRMPAGVKDALAKAALVMPFMAALSYYVWATAAPALGPGTFAATFLPLPLLSLHFGLIGLFWSLRYFAYPRLGPAGRGAFLAVAQALALAYPAAALAALGLWTASLLGAVPSFLAGWFLPWNLLLSALSPGAAAFLLGVLGVIGLIALAEVVHHFVWRAPGMKGRGGLWGNLGQQLLRMRRKP